VPFSCLYFCVKAIAVHCCCQQPPTDFYFWSEPTCLFVQAPCRTDTLSENQTCF
jgi:hypothetical protein